MSDMVKQQKRLATTLAAVQFQLERK